MVEGVECIQCFSQTKLVLVCVDWLLSKLLKSFLKASMACEGSLLLHQQHWVSLEDVNGSDKSDSLVDVFHWPVQRMWRLRLQKHTCAHSCFVQWPTCRMFCFLDSCWETGRLLRLVPCVFLECIQPWPCNQPEQHHVDACHMYACAQGRIREN